MSYPPPIPPEGPPGGPSYPMPVQALEYTEARYRGRPSVLTAVGIMSIIIACIGFLAGLWGGLMSIGFLAMSVRGGMPVATASSSTVVTYPPPPVPGAPAVVAPSNFDEIDGLPDVRRAQVLASLQRLYPLSRKRSEHLDSLLAQAGLKIFPFAGNDGSYATIRSNVSEKGALPASGGGVGAIYYVVGTGRIEVYDDHAIFRPDGSADVVSVSAPSADADPNAVPMPAPSPMPPRFNSRSRVSVRVTPSGASVTSVPVTMKTIRVPTGPAVVSIIESFASLLLAVLLLIAGIFVLRDSPTGRKLHWYYVWIKIPLIVVAGISGWLLWSGIMTASMTAASPRGSPPPPFNPAVLFGAFGVGAALISLAYPLALIFILRSRQVQLFYSNVRASSQ